MNDANTINHDAAVLLLKYDRLERSAEVYFRQGFERNDHRRMARALRLQQLAYNKFLTA